MKILRLRPSGTRYKNSIETLVCLAWQDITSKIIFFIVIIIVLTGLVLAGIQFRTASEVDITAGREGLHLKTTIVGVVILAMSMVFLFLYLFFVYPIKGIK